MVEFKDLATPKVVAELFGMDLDNPGLAALADAFASIVGGTSANTPTTSPPRSRTINRTSPIKPRGPKPTTRRTRAAMGEIRQALNDALAEDHPMTVRQCFYRL